MRAVAAALVIAIAAAVAAASPAPPKPTRKLLATGKRVYAGACEPCHGASGKGDGPVAFAVKPPPRNLVTEPFKAGDSVAQIFATITNGLPDTRMIGYPQIAEADRWALAHHVRSLRTAGRAR